MIGDELRESVLKWAKLQKKPFLTAEVFENIEEAETLKEASDSLRKLFLSGDLARKKIDNVRYAYIVSEIAPFEFEKCFPDSDKNSGEYAQACGEKQQETGAEKSAPKQQRKPERKASNDVTRVMRKYVRDAGLGDLLSKEESAESATPALIESVPDTQETTLQSVKPLEMPEGFTLKLQTPGGLIITIASGVNNGTSS